MAADAERQNNFKVWESVETSADQLERGHYPRANTGRLPVRQKVVVPLGRDLLQRKKLWKGDKLSH